METDRICIKGAKAICHAVGENPKEIVRLVREDGLPAWKRKDRGAWRALPEDLAEWMRKQRNRHMPAQ
ncbi:MAG: DNA-binding protein [Desulfovibrionaceae bacterium]